MSTPIKPSGSVFPKFFADLSGIDFPKHPSGFLRFGQTLPEGKRSEECDPLGLAWGYKIVLLRRYWSENIALVLYLVYLSSLE